MQDRYVGDIGDFGKYGLLRYLAGCHDPGPRLTLGVIWYKVPDESHNNDGAKIQYLQQHAPKSRELKACDPSLYAAIRALVRSGRRSLDDVERSRVLPFDTMFYSEPLAFEGQPRVARAQERTKWVAEALQRTRGCDVVFADPDNGLQCASVGPYDRLGVKYAFYDELLPIVDRGQTLVVYHHTGRHAPASTQIRTLMGALLERRPAECGGCVALRYRRGGSRTFLVIPATAHRQVLIQRVRTFMAGPWARHFEVITSQADRNRVGSGPRLARQC